MLGYGSTLRGIMAGLESDRVTEAVWVGTVGDAAYEPFIRYAGVTHILNCAAEVQPPPFTDGVEVMLLPWRA